MSDLLGSGAVLRRLKVSRRVLEHLLDTHPELEPRVRVSGKRVFSLPEVAAIREALRARARVRSGRNVA